MDKQRYSQIRHASLQICSPVTEADINECGRIIGRIPGGRVLEIGCGKGEIVARILELTGAKGLGLDLPGSLATGPSPLALTQIQSGQMELRLQDAGDFLKENTDAFDVLIVVGASQAVGGFESLPHVANQLIKPGGWLILGELAWGREPDFELLKTLEMPKAALPEMAEIPAALARKDFGCIHWSAVPETQFRQYEKTLLENGTAHARAHPADGEAEEIGVRSVKWFELMEQYGLAAFAFGWGLFKKAER